MDGGEKRLTLLSCLCKIQTIAELLNKVSHLEKLAGHVAESRASVLQAQADKELAELELKAARKV